MSLQDCSCAGIVVYNPDIERLEQNIEALVGQVREVVLIDNGSSGLERIRTLAERYGCTMLSLNDNLGIAKALNVLMGYAEREGYAWALSMDQDTVASRDLVAQYANFIGADCVGAFSPSIRKRGEALAPSASEGIIEIKKCPTSGFFCNVEAFSKTEGYDEWMFIDYVDYDICMKLRIAGFKIYRVASADILQDLGKMHRVPFLYELGKLLRWNRLKNFATTYNHPPFRNFYYVRNSLYYVDKYRKYLSPRCEYIHLLKWEVKKLILEPRRLKTLRSAMMGFKEYKAIKSRGFEGKPA